jgi:hypothetical protein
MALQKLERVVWAQFCRAVAAGWARERHEVEILSALEMAPIHGCWSPAINMTWSDDSASMVLVLQGFGQLRLYPYELYADCSERGLEGMCILDCEGGWFVMLLRQPLNLSSSALLKEGMAACTQPQRQAAPKRPPAGCWGHPRGRDAAARFADHARAAAADDSR